MALFTLYYPKREILFAFVIPMPMWVLLAIYIVIPMLVRFSGSGSPGIDLGIALAGAGFAYAYKQLDLRWSQPGLGPDVPAATEDLLVGRPRAGPPSRGSGPSRPSTSVGGGRAPSVSVLPEEQLDARARRDPRQDRPRRQPRGPERGGAADPPGSQPTRPHPTERPNLMPEATPLPRVRPAAVDDLPVIVEYNRLLALETESKVLDPAVLKAGVACALADPDRLRYWVAELDGPVAAGRPGRRHPRVERLAQGLDLVVPERLRRRPVPRPGRLPHALPAHPRRGPGRPDVIGLRLYVEDANEPAQQTYQALGMKPGGYSVYEDLWIPGLS